MVYSHGHWCGCVCAHSVRVCTSMALWCFVGSCKDSMPQCAVAQALCNTNKKMRDACPLTCGDCAPGAVHSHTQARTRKHCAHRCSDLTLLAALGFRRLRGILSFSQDYRPQLNMHYCWNCALFPNMIFKNLVSMLGRRSLYLTRVLSIPEVFYAWSREVRRLTDPVYDKTSQCVRRRLLLSAQDSKTT